ncbi:uncharacterized protein LOC133526183 isoform X2 [Cydia pomonella]|uniref:uncharacterized protein LOC133526183 isoform X2 n=1 Tax=Cydia pomonella TaxID=82600 RepID=UPI002ADDB398|nr:uncharacterized protein LOC133526183 isoform X2 [Cydia pomonella]
MAEDGAGDGNSKSRDSTPELIPLRAIPLESTTKFRTGADAELIEYVRSRPVLYDPAHSRYMDNQLKNGLWNKIGRQLRASPSACKARWNNIRDNYRKALRKRSINGKLQYKFAHLLGFMDPIYKGQFEPSSSQANNSATQLSAKTENSEESNDVEDPDETQQNSANHGDQFDADVLSNQSESIVDYEMFEKSNASGSFPPHPEPQAVDAFLAAIGLTLKGLSSYHLSLAKAEIFAVVHKYELKGIVQNGWAPTNVNPFP